MDSETTVGSLVSVTIVLCLLFGDQIKAFVLFVTRVWSAAYVREIRKRKAAETPDRPQLRNCLRCGGTGTKFCRKCGGSIGLEPLRTRFVINADGSTYIPQPMSSPAPPPRKP